MIFRVLGAAVVVLLAGCEATTSGTPTPAPVPRVGVTIQSDAMSPTLRRGDNVFFRPPKGEIHAGDIVRFGWKAGDPQQTILRVIAVGGQTVACCAPDDHITIDGTPKDVGLTPFGPVEVPEDHLWLMGDNRNEAEDSRVKGTVAAGNVTGVLDPPR